MYIYNATSIWRLFKIKHLPFLINDNSQLTSVDHEIGGVVTPWATPDPTIEYPVSHAYTAVHAALSKLNTWAFSRAGGFEQDISKKFCFSTKIQFKTGFKIPHKLVKHPSRHFRLSAVTCLHFDKYIVNKTNRLEYILRKTLVN